jgi:methionine sulfoxide reductase heme-binding subunit
MVRRLGGLRWRRLQQASYLIALLALVHFFQQVKLDVWVPTLVAGFFTWLMGHRVITWLWKAPGEVPTWLLLALTIAVAILTFAGEAIGLAIAYNVSPLLVLETAFDLDLDNLDTIRPGWFVLSAGLCVVVLDFVRARWRTSAGKGAPMRGTRERKPKIV